MNDLPLPLEYRTELYALLARLNPDALVLEPRRVYDQAIVGITAAATDHWPRYTPSLVAVYAIELCVAALVEHEGMTQEDAIEWVMVNTSGTWQGEGTPMLISLGLME